MLTTYQHLNYKLSRHIKGKTFSHYHLSPPGNHSKNSQVVLSCKHTIQVPFLISCGSQWQPLKFPGTGPGVTQILVPPSPVSGSPGGSGPANSYRFPPSVRPMLTTAYTYCTCPAQKEAGQISTPLQHQPHPLTAACASNSSNWPKISLASAAFAPIEFVSNKNALPSCWTHSNT